MRLMEYETASWFCCLLTTLQGPEAYLPHTVGQKKDIICSCRRALVPEDLLPDHAFVSHEIPRQGRDHVVTRRAGEGVFVIENVLF